MSFRFSNDPNALPQETQGFEEWLAELEAGQESETGLHDSYERSGTIKSACGEYIMSSSRRTATTAQDGSRRCTAG